MRKRKSKKSQVSSQVLTKIFNWQKVKSRMVRVGKMWVVECHENHLTLYYRTKQRSCGKLDCREFNSNSLLRIKRGRENLHSSILTLNAGWGLVFSLTLPLPPSGFFSLSKLSCLNFTKALSYSIWHSFSEWNPLRTLIRETKHAH